MTDQIQGQDQINKIDKVEDQTLFMGYLNAQLVEHESTNQIIHRKMKFGGAPLSQIVTIMFKTSIQMFF